MVHKRGRRWGFYEDQHTSIKLPRPNLLGAHQIQNAGIALAALNYLSAPKSPSWGNF